MIEDVDAFGGKIVFCRFTADKAKLGDPALINDFLYDAVNSIGMVALGKPLIHRVKDQLIEQGAADFIDDGGVTGILTLSTSHIAIHTWTMQEKATLLVYSCRRFEDKKVVEEVYRSFEPFTLCIKDLSGQAFAPMKPITLDEMTCIGKD